MTGAPLIIAFIWLLLCGAGAGFGLGLMYAAYKLRAFRKMLAAELPPSPSPYHPWQLVTARTYVPPDTREHAPLTVGASPSDTERR